MKRMISLLLTLLLSAQMMLVPAAANDDVGEFRIGVADTMYGVVALSAFAASPGTIVRAEGRPTEGFELASLKVFANGEEIATEIVNGQYVFTMPAAIVTIKATFDWIAEERFPFEDVAEDAWYIDAVKYVFKNGIMNGASTTEFLPDATTTRAMIWAMLARLDGQELHSDGENWYDDARAWAINAGISDGENPLSEITREELAVMLYRYAQRNGGGFTGSWMFLLKNPDAASVSPWADEAMHWCVMKGVIGGKSDGSLDPQGKATRAEVAATFMRYLER